MSKLELTAITQELSSLIADMRDENNFPPDVWRETKQAALDLKVICEDELKNRQFSYARLQKRIHAHKDAQLMSFVANMLDWSI